jgi:hypothetical protein
LQQFSQPFTREGKKQLRGARQGRRPDPGALLAPLSEQERRKLMKLLREHTDSE